MSKLFGPIAQNAFVVPDIDKAIEYWTETLRVGPFFKFPKIEFAEADYRGNAHSPEFDSAVGYWGEIQIELVQPKGPSIFQEFQDAGRTGVHHMAVLTTDMDAACADVEARGGTRLQGGTFADGSKLAYFDMAGPEPWLLEVCYMKEGPLALAEALKAAYYSWDGVTKTITF